jgi:hypothetical protein
VTNIVSNAAAVREGMPTRFLALCRADVECDFEDAVEWELEVAEGVAEQARTLGDNIAALYPLMQVSALGEISEALGVPVSQLLSPDFDAASVPRPPELRVVRD